MHACTIALIYLERGLLHKLDWNLSQERPLGMCPSVLNCVKRLKKSPVKIIRYSVQLHESIPIHTCKGSFATLYLAPNHQVRESESFGWRGWKCKDFHPFLRQMLSCPLQVQSVSISILIRFQEHLGPILVFFLVWKLKKNVPTDFSDFYFKEDSKLQTLFVLRHLLASGLQQLIVLYFVLTG